MWEILKIIIGVGGGLLVVYLGILALRTLASNQAADAKDGELRKVKLTYLCDICSSEVQMRMAPSEDPDPPRHCGEDMHLQAPVE